MTNHSPSPGLQYEITSYSEYTTTDVHGLPETTIKFAISWPVDRPYDAIQSGITFDHRGRLKEISLRPGPLKQSNWSYTGARSLVETAVEQSNPPFNPTVSIKDHHGRLWRTHVNADSDDATGTQLEVLDWTLDFIESYRSAHEAGATTPPTPPQTNLPCFECEARPATHILECRVTDSVEEDIAVCPDCVSSCLSYPFVKQHTSRSHPITRRPLHG